MTEGAHLLTSDPDGYDGPQTIVGKVSPWKENRVFRRGNLPEPGENGPNEWTYLPDRWGNVSGARGNVSDGWPHASDR